MLFLDLDIECNRPNQLDNAPWENAVPVTLIAVNKLDLYSFIVYVVIFCLLLLEMFFWLLKGILCRFQSISLHFEVS